MNETADPSRLEPAAQAAKVDILNAPISQTTCGEALRCLEQPATEGRRVLAFRTLHSAMSVRENPRVYRALLGAGIATADGMPLVGVLRTHQPPVRGDLIEIALAAGVPPGWRHFLVGTTDESLLRLTANADALPPGAKVIGTFAPLYRPLTSADEDDIVEAIRNSRADLVWVGMGMPEPGLCLNRLRERLPGVTLLDIGAVCGVFSGTGPRAPDSIQDGGVEGSCQLWNGPRRLLRNLSCKPALTVTSAIEVARNQSRCNNHG